MIRWWKGPVILGLRPFLWRKILRDRQKCRFLSKKFNVEAFRYYLVLESRQLHLPKIMEKMAPTLVFVIYICLVTGGLYTCIKRGIIVLLLGKGSREPQNSSRRWSSRFFIYGRRTEGTGRENIILGYEIFCCIC